MHIILLYITVIFLWITYFNYQTNSLETEKKQRNGMEKTGIVAVVIALIGPLFTLALNKIAGIDFKDLGPAGDWLAGSTTPFLTFGAFIMAYATFNSQKEQLKMVREEAERQNNNLNIQRFENTFFILIDEMKKAEYTIEEKAATASIGNNKINTEDLFELIKQNCKISRAEFKKRTEDLGSLPWKEASFEINKFILDKYLVNLNSLLMSNSIKSRINFTTLLEITRKIFELVDHHNLEVKSAVYYLDFIRIHLSQSSLLLMLYISLFEFNQENGLFDIFTKYDFFNIFENNSNCIHSINDYNLVEFLKGLDPEDRKKIDPF